MSRLEWLLFAEIAAPLPMMESMEVHNVMWLPVFNQ